MTPSLISLIQGGKHEDARGKLTFFNDFDMKQVRRFYVIEHPNTTIVRAWQAHKAEQKWFYVIAGSFKIALVQPDDWIHPSPVLEAQEFTLESEKNVILHIPGGFANGFRALEPHSRLMVFSDVGIDKAGSDDFRFDKNLWYRW